MKMQAIGDRTKGEFWNQYIDGEEEWEAAVIFRLINSLLCLLFDL